MNKISKKIVALVTMAAFVLTLVPMAAFADTAVSTYTVTGNTDSTNYNTATVDISLTDSDVTTYSANDKNIIVWAEDAQGNALEVGKDVTTSTTGWNIHQGFGKGKDNVYYQNASAKMSIALTFTKVGTYTIYVAKNDGSTVADQVSSRNAALVKNGVSFTTANAADRSKSEYGVMDKNGVLQATASVPMNEDLTTTFKINDYDSHATNAPLNDVDVYAIDSRTDSKTSYMTVNGQTVSGPAYVYEVDATNGLDLDVQFSRAGEYTLYAEDSTGRVIGSTKVTVTDTTAVDHMTLTASWIDENVATNEEAITGDAFKYDPDAKTYTLDLTQVDGFNFNGIDKVVLNGEAFNEDGTDALNQTIKFSASEPNTVVELDNTSDNTSNTGTFETAFVMHSQKNTVITVKDEATGVSYDVLVVAQKTSATNIDRTKTAGYVLATTDDQWSADVNANLGDAVEFKVTDEKGNAVEGLTNADFVIDVRSKAGKSELTASDLEVVEVGDGFYTLKVNNVTPGDKTLTEGKYEVRVALNGVDSENDNATVTFNAAEFGKIKNVELNIKDANGIALDDQITLKTKANVSLVYVDANGVKVAGPGEFNWNATNSALAIQDVHVEKDKNYFTLKADSIEHQGVVGSVVKVQASVKDYGLVEKELTIVSSYNEYSMKFDPTEGPVNEYNKVDLSVLNSDGDVAKNIGGDVNVVVVDSSNEDAKVSAKANGAVEKGEGSLTVYASQETELELVVTVVKDGKILAADTLNYTVGAADPLAGRSVVMTIGSSEYVVNNQIITGDAAPFVDSNWRTMVPIRALAEAFDAEVNWDNDARTVTINYDANTQIVMTIGEDTYTVNGADKTMDTEPVIQGDRTYVPIRFAAEALGFTVTPLYTAEGTTGSVVFQR